MDYTTLLTLLEEQLRVHLKAARHLAACWEYGETQFDEVQDILREAPLGGSMTPAQRAEVKRRACALLPESGVAPWDQMRVIDYASLAKAVSEFLAVLIATTHTEETRAFIRQAKHEMDEIHVVIQREIIQRALGKKREPGRAGSLPAN